uniref:Phosphoprotein n=1 Tax=Morbillivirus canis TaxID=3052342 RepID=A0A873F3T6_9MONO|nr:phosphoprotein [Morbillivirus canis]
MAEEQAYHVSKGLECLKTLRENPPDIKEIQEVSSIRDQTRNPGQENGTTSMQEEEVSQDLDESHEPAEGSNYVGHVLQNNPGCGESNTALVEAEQPAKDDIQPGPGIRRYHVYDHSGEEVKGIADADSLVVPAGAVSNRGFERGEGSIDDSTEDSGEDYSEGNASSNWGYSFGLKPDRAADVSMLMEEELSALLRTSRNVGIQKRDGKTLQFPHNPEGKTGDPECGTIKKGTGERLASHGMGIVAGSTNGATQSAPKSTGGSSGPSVSAENVRQPAMSAKMTQKCKPESGTQLPPRTSNEAESDSEYDDELFSEMQEIRAAITKLTEDNQAILSKLDTLLLLKGETDSIKKQISKQNIAISTIEGHLSSIMIAIPGFGKDTGDPTANVDINPELRPIIGRDSGRALAEVLKQPASSRSNRKDSGIALGSKGQLLRDLQLKPIDKESSSAIGYKPKDTAPSKAVLASLIRSSRVDQSHKHNMLALLKNIKGDDNLNEFYQMIKSITHA